MGCEKVDEAMKNGNEMIFLLERLSSSLFVAFQCGCVRVTAGTAKGVDKSFELRLSRERCGE